MTKKALEQSSIFIRIIREYLIPQPVVEFAVFHISKPGNKRVIFFRVYERILQNILAVADVEKVTRVTRHIYTYAPLSDCKYLTNGYVQKGLSNAIRFSEITTRATRRSPKKTTEIARSRAAYNPCDSWKCHRRDRKQPRGARARRFRIVSRRLLVLGSSAR